MKEHCFSIAIEAPNYQKDTLVLGRLVRALHNAGFRYQSIKEIAAQDHWDRTATANNSAMLKLLNDTHGYLFTYGHMNKAASTDFLNRYNAVIAQLPERSLLSPHPMPPASEA